MDGHVQPSGDLDVRESERGHLEHLDFAGRETLPRVDPFIRCVQWLQQ